MRIRLLFQVLLAGCSFAHAQTLYTIEATKANTPIKSGHFSMGNPGPAGKEIKINSRYMTLGGEPIVPVMGEMHFSRTPKERWEDVILKMKACGVNIISTYLFWNHHEEIEGQFEWSGNKDLRSFIQLCAKHHVWVYPRLGPWAHGEARNGGTPDWILTKKNLKNRTNDIVYQQYVERYFEQIGIQTKGLLYKDGGPIVGIQLENEYTRGKAGEPHILWLKQTAVKYGLDVPMYTVTGWGDGSVPKGEVIPLWGGYPDQPWDPTIEKLNYCSDFEFNPFRNDDKIGNGLAQKKDQYLDYSDDPFFTCEMGVGVQTTRHRRSVIDAIDGLAMVTNRVGSGSNLLGYYMFAGGSNPRGVLTGLQEDKDETGNWSETPVISYDFQGAVRENGQLAPSYFEVKKLNYFLNEFGKELAPMEPVFAKTKNEFQYALRANGKQAFLFGINYCRFVPKAEKKGVQFKIKLPHEEIVFPSQPVNIPDSSIFIWPVNLNLNGTVLRYATAQPLAKLDDQQYNAWIFFQTFDQAPEFSFDGAGVAKIESATGNVTNVKGHYILTGLKPGTECVITIFRKDGSVQKVVVLTRQQAHDAWIFSVNGKKEFFICREGMYASGTQLYVAGSNADQQIMMFNPGHKRLGNSPVSKTEEGSLFSAYRNTLPGRVLQPDYEQKKILDDAQWLKTSVSYIDSKSLLNHKIFLKEFNLGNPSQIKSSILYVAAETSYRVQVNNVWVNQNTTPGQLSSIDITGYVKKGDNTLMLDFPVVKGDYAFAARVITQYFNSDEMEFYTDKSWLAAEQYYFPAPLGTFANFFSPPEVVPAVSVLKELSTTDFTEYEINIPCNYLEGLDNLYLNIKYLGDRAELRMQYGLMTDNFNNNTPWQIDLKRDGSQLQCRKLKLKIFPFQAGDKILFDKPIAEEDWEKAAIQSLTFTPWYKAVFTMD